MGPQPRITGYLPIPIVMAAVLAAAGVAATAAGASAAPASVTSWPTAGHDIGNTRDAPDEHVIGSRNVPRLTVDWSVTTTGEVRITPTVDDGTVYFPDTGGRLWAVAADTGRVLWSREVSSYTGFPAVSRTSPAVYGHELIFGDSDTSVPGHSAYIFGADRRTGRLLWSTRVDAHPAAISTSSPVIYHGIAYLGVSSVEEDLASEAGYQCCSFRGSVIALDAATGRILWKTYTVPPGYSGGGVWGSTPVIDPAKGLLYVGTGNNYSVPAGVCTSPTQTGCILPAADDHVDSVLALDPATGSIRWFRPTVTTDVSNSTCGQGPNPACGADADFGSGPNLIQLPSGRQLIGIGQKSGAYWALDPRTGAVVWRTLLGPGLGPTGIQWGSATDGRHVYVAITDLHGLPYQIISADGHTTTTTDGGSWTELDATTGKIVWQVADPQRAADPGYVSTANGLVYVGSTAATGTDMYVLDAATGGILWSFAGDGPVASGAAIVRGTVYWGSGNQYATRCPHGAGAIQECAGSGDKVYAFSLSPPA